MLWLIGAYLAGMGFLVWIMLNAPEGYEDDQGFHYGRPEE